MQKLDNTTLYEVYKALNNRCNRIKEQIGQIDEKIKHCNRTDKDFLLEFRKSLVDRLDGINTSIDIVVKAMAQGSFY